MGRFENTMGIDSITMERSIRCFCPIGRSWCTYDLTMHINPGNVIPDYIEVGEYLKGHVDGKEFTLEGAVAAVRDYLVNEYEPKWANVSLYCGDARHMPVTVTVTYLNEGGENEE